MEVKVCVYVCRQSMVPRTVDSFHEFPKDSVTPKDNCPGRFPQLFPFCFDSL